MRIVNVAGRLGLRTGSGIIDVAEASANRFGPDPQGVYEQWDAFREWAAGQTAATEELTDPGNLGAPSPRPRQVFAIGLNYRDHAAESGMSIPDSPLTFTKFPSSITGPTGELRLPSDNVDWEVELVVVIGRRAHRVAVEDAWSYVAGLTVGQDYSERVVQQAGPAPQFSLGKSFPGFGPTGPELVTVDEFADPADLALESLINGESMQKSRTSQMIFPVPELIARLSAILPLLPGDLIFTGTPHGVGQSRTPKRFLTNGDEVVSHIEGIGWLRQTCVAD